MVVRRNWADVLNTKDRENSTAVMWAEALQDDSEEGVSDVDTSQGEFDQGESLEESDLDRDQMNDENDVAKNCKSEGAERPKKRKRSLSRESLDDEDSVPPAPWILRSSRRKPRFTTSDSLSPSEGEGNHGDDLRDQQREEVELHIAIQASKDQYEVEQKAREAASRYLVSDIGDDDREDMRLAWALQASLQGNDAEWKGGCEPANSSPDAIRKGKVKSNDRTPGNSGDDLTKILKEHQATAESTSTGQPAIVTELGLPKRDDRRTTNTPITSTQLVSSVSIASTLDCNTSPRRPTNMTGRGFNKREKELIEKHVQEPLIHLRSVAERIQLASPESESSETEQENLMHEAAGFVSDGSFENVLTKFCRSEAKVIRPSPTKSSTALSGVIRRGATSDGRPATPPPSQDSNEHGPSPYADESMSDQLATLLEEKGAWQKEKATLVAENAKLLQQNATLVQRQADQMRRLRTYEQLCFPVADK